MISSPVLSTRHVSCAEYIMEGHPDKLSDIIADSILDEYLEHDKNARVACEVLVAKELVVVAGEISSSYQADIEGIVRQTILDIGYLDSACGMSGNDCRVIRSLSEQSPSLRNVLLPESLGEPLRASDQAVVVGFATQNCFGMIPPASFIAKKIAIEVGARRHSGQAPFLRPDGKTLVQVEADAGGCPTVRQIVVSAQHVPEATPAQICMMVHSIVPSCIQGAVTDKATQLTINPPSGRFSFGGPAADTGLTGRKVVADCYGPGVPHGGGSFSGKDPTKIDRCGAYAARWVAKSLVMSGVAATALVSLSYVIGVAEPTSIAVALPDRDARQENQIIALVQDKFDLRAGAIIERLDLLRPLYLRATQRAHFGIDSTLPWEQARTDL